MPLREFGMAIGDRVAYAINNTGKPVSEERVNAICKIFHYSGMRINNLPNGIMETLSGNKYSRYEIDRRTKVCIDAAVSEGIIAVR